MEEKDITPEKKKNQNIQESTSWSSQSTATVDSWIGELKITTFNLLAPCYKRKSYGRESTFEQDWRKRLNELLVFLEKDLSSSDIICFQEYWSGEIYCRILENKIQ